MTQHGCHSAGGYVPGAIVFEKKPHHGNITTHRCSACFVSPPSTPQFFAQKLQCSDVLLLHASMDAPLQAGAVLVIEVPYTLKML
mmetsp:Transcript_22441/g.37537  ORF Transcript_22441/g.37537 Transcript_22441/m.37537 type:complete len:85 (+) Transcript_22441:271-525(+)